MCKKVFCPLVMDSIANTTCRIHTYACTHAHTHTHRPSGPIDPSDSNDLKEGNEEERQCGGRLVHQLHQVHTIAKHKHKTDTRQVDGTDNG